MNIFGSNNIYLWLLIILLVTGSGNGCGNGGIFSGCGLPITLALVYCLTKNGTLDSIFGGGNSSNGCGCGCS